MCQQLVYLLENKANIVMPNLHILQLVKQGDKSAFTILFNQYWKSVYNFTKLYLISKEDAEEIVQDVFAQLWDIKEQLDEEKNIEGLLFIITRNLIFDHSRKNFNHDFFKITIQDSLEIHAEDEANRIALSDLLEHVRLLINKLPERQKEIFILSREKQFSHKEISELLSISPRTVERHISEATKFLRKNIPEEFHIAVAILLSVKTL